MKNRVFWIIGIIAIITFSGIVVFSFFATEEKSEKTTQLEKLINLEDDGALPPVNEKETDKGGEIDKAEEILKINTMINIKTNKGDIKIELFDEERPITVGNFTSLVGKNFYDGVVFHRVISGFMIQGGCPEGIGTGGPGHSIRCEIDANNKNNRGTISMANAGKDTGGSQFFINLVDNNFLDEKHSVFGRVVEGMDIVDIIAGVKTDNGDRPIESIIIEKIEIIEEIE